MQINGTIYMAVAPEGTLRMKAFETDALTAAVATVDYPDAANPLNFSLTVTNPVPHIVKIYDSPGSADGTLLADFLYDPKYSAVEIRVNKTYVAGNEGTPVVGETSFSDDDLDGYDFWLERRGYGTLELNEEWQPVDGGGFKLLYTGDTFQDGDIFTVHFYPKITTATPGQMTVRFITDIAILTADTTLDSGHYNKLLSLASLTNTITATLPLISATPALTVFAFTTNMGLQVNAAIKTSGTDSIFWGNDNQSAVYLGQNEQLILMRGTGGWFVLQAPTSFNTVGSQIWADMVLPGSLERNGALLTRAVYPRLFNWYVNKLPAGMLVSEATWATDATTNRGKFTLGDGATTFRIPDSRGLFVRGADDGRGVDTGRAVGSYQADMIGPHTHLTKFKEVGGIQNNNNGGGLADKIRPYDPTNENAWITSELNDGTETRTKNEAKIPLILF